MIRANFIFAILISMIFGTVSYHISTPSRRNVIKRSFLFGGFLVTNSANAAPSLASEPLLEPKQINLTPNSIASIVKSDVLDRQFLASAKLTRSIYSESATFTDEIDTYTLPKWIKGTQALFNSENSKVLLVGDVTATENEVTFRFDENLQFNIPFKPICKLSGKVVLKRGEDGLIISYREYWDQSVNSVLKTAKFNL
ncbi:hypothetical protein TrLO_g13276 [Triparma laevis f. longispina]|uniref:Uncharacterized protein n=1 Tax=Triparma laevis f. longispina TaxID=1714387 RepID=A0A9W7AF55_9STRA|nr:hypothetical protein TrLO_g13276 [Triparma laevis f. longispina]